MSTLSKMLSKVGTRLKLERYSMFTVGVWFNKTSKTHYFPSFSHSLQPFLSPSNSLHFLLSIIIPKSTLSFVLLNLLLFFLFLFPSFHFSLAYSLTPTLFPLSFSPLSISSCSKSPSLIFSPSISLTLFSFSSPSFSALSPHLSLSIPPSLAFLHLTLYLLFSNIPPHITLYFSPT